MKMTFVMKDANFLVYAAKHLRKKLEQEGILDEDQIEDEVDKFTLKFRYGEYLDLEYDTETGLITTTK